MEYLEIRGLMDGGQHGSRLGRSTLTQLIKQYDLILELLLEGSNIDIIYLDFEKAFDKCDLGVLIKKINDIGIKGKLGAWLGAFVLGRRQAVKVGGSTSSWLDVISGVPQGSVIGPLLFLIYIGDLGKDIKDQGINILKFVDDTKIMKAIRKHEDVEALQDAKVKMEAWQSANNMSFNTSKFQLLRLEPNINI